MNYENQKKLTSLIDDIVESENNLLVEENKRLKSIIDKKDNEVKKMKEKYKSVNRSLGDLKTINQYYEETTWKYYAIEEIIDEVWFDEEYWPIYDVVDVEVIEVTKDQKYPPKVEPVVEDTKIEDEDQLPF